MGKRNFKNLKTGDMINVANQLKESYPNYSEEKLYQRVRDVASERVRDDLIASTLMLLDEERKKETAIKAKKAVKNILTY